MGIGRPQLLASFDGSQDILLFFDVCYMHLGIREVECLKTQRIAGSHYETNALNWKEQNQSRRGH
jgi:hypothetical protein